MKRVVLFPAAFLICLLIVLNADMANAKNSGIEKPKELFFAANKHYEEKDYKKAIDTYEEILNDGYQSGALYYNLANSYFKSGILGKAVLNYERALVTLPRDSDVRSNYHFARRMVNQDSVKAKGLWIIKLARKYYQYLTIDELAGITSMLYIFLLLVISLALIWHFMKSRIVVLCIIIVFIVSAINISFILDKVYNKNTLAVVTVPRVDVLYGPFDTATKFFTLYEGSDVNLVKTKEGWYKIRRPDGKVGWARARGIVGL